MRKDVEALLPDDFTIYPVWEFVTNAEDVSDTQLEPVRHLPVNGLDNRIVGTNVRLANGTLVPAVLGNIDLADSQKTQHLITLSLFHNGIWQHLTRYHDPGVADHGPDAIAAALQRSIGDIFPIVYDIRRWCNGNSLCTTGEILAWPAEKLSRDEIIGLAL